MQVDYLILADSVAVAEGKHYIHGGGWDTLYTSSFPIVHPMFGVAASLRVPADEQGEQLALEVDIQSGEEGSSILTEPIGGIVSAVPPPHAPPDSDLLLHLAFSFASLQFDNPGIYNIVLRVDGQSLAELPFKVIPLPELPE
jgi:uncharacterized protein DUF6941